MQQHDFQVMFVQVGSDRLAILARNAWPSALPGLTPAEQEICQLVVRGMSNTAAARERGTSAHTVTNQLRAVFQKLRVFSRVELAAALFGFSHSNDLV